MAYDLCPMEPTRDDIRRARNARGWSQQRLAAEAGVSATSVSRIERGIESEDSPSRPAVIAALGLGDAREADGPPLRRATHAELAAEMVRRLGEADRIMEHARIRRGEVPPELLDDPKLIRSSDRHRHGKPDDRHPAEG